MHRMDNNRYIQWPRFGTPMVDPGSRIVSSFEFGLLGGIKIDVFQGVYSPDEDTFLLLENIEPGAGTNFLEVGVGTGLVSICAARRGARVWGTDINPVAVENARHNAVMNGATFVNGDLLGSLEGSYDMIVFNPPYLPQGLGGGDGGDISADERSNLIGGSVGTEIADRFLSGCKGRLREGGRIYLVVSTLGDPDRLYEEHAEEYSFEIIATRLYEGESLLLVETREKA